MRKLEIAGSKFGRLTAVAYSHSANGSAYWTFSCECGGHKLARAVLVKRGSISSCGCIPRGETTANKRIGKRYGRLVVISRHKAARFVCQCDCGTETIVSSCHLTTGLTTSCGCYHREKASEAASRLHRQNPHFNKNPNTGWFIDYGDHRLALRSCYELIYANHLRCNKIKFLYEPEIFELNKETRYMPDFYLPENDQWIEIKGYVDTKDHLKHDLFRQTNRSLTVITAPEIYEFLPKGMTYRNLLKQWKAGDHSFALVI